MRVPCLFLTAVLILPITADAQEAQLIGRVLSNESSNAIAGATIRIGDNQWITNQRGQFTAGPLSPGTHVMHVEMLGYATRTDTISLAEGVHDLVVRLNVRPIAIAPVTIVVRSPVLDDVGFYDRRDKGGISGRFIDRAEIERKDPMVLTDLFRDVSGAKVHRFGPGTSVIRFNRAQMGGLSSNTGASEPRQKWLASLPGCQPDVFIDGRQHYDMMASGQGLITDFNMLSPMAIEAMEVYVGANVPTQFRNNGCGVVLIWTRRGR